MRVRSGRSALPRAAIGRCDTERMICSLRLPENACQCSAAIDTFERVVIRFSVACPYGLGSLRESSNNDHDERRSQCVRRRPTGVRVQLHRHPARHLRRCPGGAVAGAYRHRPSARKSCLTSLPAKCCATTDFASLQVSPSRRRVSRPVRCSTKWRRASWDWTAHHTCVFANWSRRLSRPAQRHAFTTPFTRW